MTDRELAEKCLRIFSQEGAGGLLAHYDELFSEGFEWRPPIAEMTGRAYVGREGLERYVADVDEILADVHPSPTFEEIAELAPGLWRSRVEMHGEGIRSGAAIDASVISVFRVSDGRVDWWWATYDPEAADRMTAEVLHDEAAST